MGQQFPIQICDLHHQRRAGFGSIGPQTPAKVSIFVDSKGADPFIEGITSAASPSFLLKLFVAPDD